MVMVTVAPALSTAPGDGSWLSTVSGGLVVVVTAPALVEPVDDAAVVLVVVVPVATE